MEEKRVLGGLKEELRIYPASITISASTMQLQGINLDKVVLLVCFFYFFHLFFFLISMIVCMTVSKFNQCRRTCYVPQFSLYTKSYL